MEQGNKGRKKEKEGGRRVEGEVSLRKMGKGRER